MSSPKKKNLTRKQREARDRRRHRARCRKARAGTQLGLGLRQRFGWGGARPGAGRKASGKKGRTPHVRRQRFHARHPLHTTLRVLGGLPSLRQPAPFAVITAALEAAAMRFGVRIVAYMVQGNHLHLVLEAADHRALARAMAGFTCRVARGLNRVLGRQGAVFEGRFHTRVLRTPGEVRSALGYVVENTRRHAQQLGILLRSLRDPFTSLGLLELRSHRPWAARAVGPPVTAPPLTWLLRAGWQLA